MSQSRHFTRRKIAKVVKDAASFNSEIEKFDIENKSKLKSTIKIEKPLNKNKKKRTINHIKLEYENNEFDNNKKSENISSLPENFFPMYNKIKEMRELIITPVDLVGCFRIPIILKYITNKFKSDSNFKPIDLKELPNLKKEFDLFKIDSKNDRFQLLVTLLFSSQTKDEINFAVMQNLHLHYLNLGYIDGLSIKSILNTSETELNDLIFQIGFHKRKASYLLETTKFLSENYNNDIPKTIDELIKLKGIGYKMGNLILQGGWNITTGISVDTHMVRLCNLYNWYKDKNPENVRKFLESALINHKEIWNEINPVLVGFGQSICTPVGRRCDLCLLSSINNKNDVLCPAIDKRLLLRVKNGFGNEDRKIRGDLEKLLEYKNS